MARLRWPLGKPYRIWRLELEFPGRREDVDVEAWSMQDAVIQARRPGLVRVLRAYVLEEGVR